MERKLAAIVSADVAGYSRLMGDDEQGTLAALRAHRDELIDPKIEEFGGRIANTAGDSVLIEFPSVVDALRCAVEVQHQMAARNASIPEDQRISFRIGINLGDVIARDGDLFGDGVNIAARLQEIAEPGGITVSASAHEAARRQVDFEFESLGEHKLKNISDPIAAYRVALAGLPSTALPPGFLGRRTPLWSVVFIVAFVAVAGLWRLLPRDEPPPPTSVEETMRLFDQKPSIAVLPFANLSGDPEQEYFADGMAEDIITDLSKLKALFVIARNTTFQYKGKAIDVKKVGRTLGVRYVLEGSVRRAGSTVRINAQLIDTKSGGHLWAERYDGDMSDVFKLQDQVTEKIVSSLALVLDPSARQALAAKETDNIEAHDAFLRGLRHLNVRSFERAEFILKAREAFEKAVALDPNYARAYAGLGLTYWDQYAVEVTRTDHKAKALEFAAKSLALRQNALALRLNARRYFTTDIYAPASYMGDQHDLASAELRKAIALEPNGADALAELAYTLVFSGGAKKAAQLMQQAKRLNPNFPNWYHRPAGMAHYFNKDYAKAIPELKAWVASEPVLDRAKLWLAAAQAQAGDVDQARTMIEDMLRRRRASGQLLYATGVSRWWSFASEADRLHLRAGLIKAGLPPGGE